MSIDKNTESLKQMVINARKGGLNITMNYIEMCRKAKEIEVGVANIKKEELILRGGDQLLSINKIGKSHLDVVQPEYSGTITHPLSGEVVWLPRLDQLLRMFPDFDKDYPRKKIALQMFGKMFYGALSIEDKYDYDFETTEEYLLAIVMEQKHNKIWDNNVWVKV